MAAFRRDRIQKPYGRPVRTSDDFWQRDKPQALTPQQNVPNTKLVVSNLHYEITPKDLISIFGQIGTLVREPVIRYDRSGRSSGIAYISFETPAEATKAKKQFEGILAKGQPMSITYDTARRSVSAPSLINRIQKQPLLHRLSKDSTPTEPRASIGPIRARPVRREAAPRLKKPPKTVEDLDKELDAYLIDGKEDTVPAPSAPAAPSAPLPEADVEMA